MTTNAKLFATLLLFGLSACSQEVPHAPVPKAPPVATVAGAPDGASESSAAMSLEQKVDSSIFSITQLGERPCSEGGAATAVAKWNVSSLNAAAVSIYVESPDNDKKLWLEGGAAGEATTGEWLFEKSRFTLQEKDTGRLLATHLVEVIRCTR